MRVFAAKFQREARVTVKLTIKVKLRLMIRNLTAKFLLKMKIHKRPILIRNLKQQA